MKTFGRMLIRALLLGSAMWSFNSSAQKEQWLEYYSGSETRGYRWLDLSTNAPTGVALPKLKAQPWLAHWTSPMDPSGGRWLCLDRSKSSGLYDILYIDGNGDGRLDDEKPISTERVDEYYAYFRPAKLVFKGEDGPVTYHLALRFMKYSDDTTRLLASSAGYYAGVVNFAGKKRRIELVDGNVNGTFNDRSENPGECDRILIDKDDERERYLGKLIEVDGTFCRIEVARDGAFLKLQMADDLAFGKVRVPEAISRVVAFGENGHFFRKPAKGEFTLPLGRYRVSEWVIARKDSSGSSWELTGYGSPESAAFDLTAQPAPALRIGEPIRARLSTSQPSTRSNQIVFNLSFMGAGGESIQIMKSNQRPPGPKLALLGADPAYRSTNTFEFG